MNKIRVDCHEMSLEVIGVTGLAASGRGEWRTFVVGLGVLKHLNIIKSSQNDYDKINTLLSMIEILTTRMRKMMVGK